MAYTAGGGPPQEPSTRRKAESFLLAGALLIFFGWAFRAWFMPSRAPRFRSLSLWDTLVDRPWIIGALRLLGAAVGIYILVSIFARLRRGQWLSSVGPFKVDEQVTVITGERDRLQAELQRAEETIKDLREQLGVLLSLSQPKEGHTEEGEGG